jgi:hypothetical protein
MEHERWSFTRAIEVIRKEVESGSSELETSSRGFSLSARARQQAAGVGQYSRSEPRAREDVTSLDCDEAPRTLKPAKGSFSIRRETSPGREHGTNSALGIRGLILWSPGKR